MTANESGRNLVQLAIQKRVVKKTVVSSGSKSRNTYTLSPVWFDVRLRDENGDVPQLQAGCTYNLVIKGGLNRSTFHAEGILIPDGIELHLHCALDREALLKLDRVQNSFSLTHQKASTFKEEFTISIPCNFPSCNLTLGLSYTLPNTYREILGERTISIAGTYTPADRQLLEVSQLGAELPEDVAILVVSSHPNLSQEHAFKIRGWHLYGGLLEETSTSSTIVSVAKLMEHRDNPQAILGKIRLFSEDSPKHLKTWLRSLYQKYGSSLSMIVVDGTDLEIPWEMYELDDEKYLGALAKVVRWIPPRRSAEYKLNVYNVCYEGSVIAYIDTTLGEHETIEERTILQDLHTEPYATLRELENRIRMPLEQVGLVYIGCHGANGSTLQQQYPDQLKATYLTLIRKHPEPRPIALINACESGRIVRGNEWGESSFVEILLQRCVSGYIGTLGKVGTLKASRIAGKILERAKSAEGVQIAEILRRFREEAVLQLGEAYNYPHCEREKYEYNLLYTFMYVYYGNPLTRLRLYSANQKKEGP